jgi:hypothetical protein
MQRGVAAGALSFACALALAAGRVAHAEPRSLTGAYSAYELQAIGDADGGLHTSIEP